MSLLGIEIGGSKLVLTVGDEAGRPIRHLRRPMAPSGSWQQDLDRIIDEARSLLSKAPAPGEGLEGRPEEAPLRAIGISSPGPFDPSSGVVPETPNLPGWRDVPIVEALEIEFNVAVRLENDANAAALAEWRFGAGRGVENLVYLTMSTGIGGGLILGGRLYRGAFGGAGEIGHCVIEPQGRPCACGRIGCLEAYCGGNAWQAWLRAETPESSDVFSRAGSRTAIKPEHLVQAAHADDDFARQALSEWVARLSQGLVQLVMTFEPQRIVLGTIAVAAGESLCFEPLRERVEAALWPHQKGRLEIVPAMLGDSMPQHAGLSVALEEAARETGLV